MSKTKTSLIIVGSVLLTSIIASGIVEYKARKALANLETPTEQTWE